MSTNTPVVGKRTQPVPPEEQFWKRYSPHHEFPLSTVSSFALHILAFVLLALIAWWVATMAMERDRPLGQVGVVVEGGGGGNPKGEGAGPGGPLGGGQPEEEKGDAPKEDVSPAPQTQKNTIPQPSNVPPPVSVDTKDNSTADLLRQATEAEKSLQRVSRDNQEKLRRGVGQGKGGQGRGGGQDRGTDSGRGRGTGKGQDLDVRVKRTMRWVMVFNTYDGNDYAHQLAGLGAILAFPQAKGDKIVYMAVTDLNARPAKGRIDSIEKIQGDRIYWIDDKRESITPLCNALGIRPTPDHVVAFFPKRVEDKLLELELSYKGLKEEQIFETRFAIRKTPRGYEPEVIEQKENPPQ
jgi:hypothetical protein